ncbi:unnamed protein product [Adineta steineri]|uniref:MULE transposase domain-containing protein n=1 Tax=Adineta steineri TaxID=433720 RepID=A0A815RW11_9BILA|nr:unnamed protein product [Adineta steineri]CAF1482668.1 unnamed protein product [Adineta steineri]
MSTTADSLYGSPSSSTDNSRCSSPSSSSSSINVSFFESNKGKRLLYFYDYIFKCNKATSSKRYWICVEKTCRVFIHTNLNDEFLTIVGNHNHVANPDILEMRILRAKMKSRIIHETTSITRIYDEEIAKAGLTESIAAQFPTVIEYRSNMSKARRKKTPVVPTSCVFEIPDSYQKTLSNKQFLLMDFYLKRSKERVIVYATTQQLQLLFTSTTIFMDGTFSVAPSGFEQVFLIHVEYFGQGLPVAYCLMSNRRAATYIELFQRLKHEAEVLGMQFQPTNIVSDFETALMPAVRQEFSEAIHTGCLFHFIQTVHRKIMSLGLNDDYTRCAETREQCKQLIALSLMPVHEVERQFGRLRNIASSSLDDLFIYFHRQWINGNVPLAMWNFHELNHRTNNISEAYNRRFGSRILKKYPNVWTFIQLIQSENARIEHLIVQINAGAATSRETTRTTAFQKRFENLKTRFHNDEINAKQLLHGFGMLIGGSKN